MDQKFWKLSGGSDGDLIDSFIKNKIAAIGWHYILDKPLEDFDGSSGDKSTFLEKIADAFRRKNRAPNPRKQIANFYFEIRKGDIIFLYGSSPYTITAIGRVKEPYYFDAKKSDRLFGKDYDFPYFLDINWFCDLRRNPLNIKKTSGKNILSRNTTLICLSDSRNKLKVVNELLNLAQEENPSIVFKNYIPVIRKGNGKNERPKNKADRDGEEKAKKRWFQDIDKKQKIEKNAIDKTGEHFESLGYYVKSVEADKKGWDLEAVKGKERLLIEVKGLSQKNISIELTPREYENLKKHKRIYRICVLTNSLDENSSVLSTFFCKRDKWMSKSGKVLRIEEVLKTSARMTA